MVERPRYDWRKDFRDVALRQRVDVDQELRQLLKNISSSNKGLTILEVMWWIRTNTCNQAEIPQAIFKVGDQLASVTYIELDACWEVQLDGDERQFDTFEKVLSFIEHSRRESIGLV